MPAFHRRAVLALAAATLATGAFAQEWSPTKPVRIIVPIVGSTNDVLARLVAPKLQEALGQPVVVENKPGAGGNIGADMVAKATPDGHTLLVGYNGPLAINVSLFDKMPFDPRKDFSPITLAVKSPQYLVVNPNSGIASVQDFVAKAKAAPTKYSYASVAVGSASHLTMEMLKLAAGIHVTHIPYRGAGPAVTDMLAGNVDLMIADTPVLVPQVRAGRMRALAVFGNARTPLLPEVPTAPELGQPSLVMENWYGVLAPSGVPAARRAALESAILASMARPEVAERLATAGLQGGTGTAGFRAQLARDTATWPPLLRRLNISLE